MHQVTTQRLSRAYWVAYAGMGFVGLGSFLFHATLSYEMQLMDELPMIYLACILTYTIVEADVKSRTPTPYLNHLLVVDAVGVTLTYILFPNPLFHQIAFGLHCGIIVVAGGRHYTRLMNSSAKYKLKRLLLVGWGMHALGFLCWNIDNHFCTPLRRMRTEAGAWEFLLQFHAWWHIFTGLGSYIYIVGNQWLQTVLEGNEHNHDIQWRYGFLPVMAPISSKIE
jgi:dihydroceramidase